MSPSVKSAKGVGGTGARARPSAAVDPVEDTDDDGYDDGYVAPGPGRGVRITALVLSLLGLADATYLTITHFQKHLLECPTHGFVDCLQVTTSPQSEILGIPVAVLGLAFFVAMTVINLPRLWLTTDVRVAWLRLAMAVSGIGFILYLIYAELFIIKAICEYCTGVHIVTFALFVLVVATFPSMLQRQGAEFDDGGDWEPDTEPASS